MRQERRRGPRRRQADSRAGRWVGHDRERQQRADHGAENGLNEIPDVVDDRDLVRDELREEEHQRRGENGLTREKRNARAPELLGKHEVEPMEQQEHGPGVQPRGRGEPEADEDPVGQPRCRNRRESRPEGGAGDSHGGGGGRGGAAPGGAAGSWGGAAGRSSAEAPGTCAAASSTFWSSSSFSADGSSATA